MGSKHSRLLPVFNAGKDDIEINISGNAHTKVVNYVNVMERFTLVRKEKSDEPPSKYISPGKLFVYKLKKNLENSNITVMNQNGKTSHQYLQRRKYRGIIVPMKGSLVYSRVLNFDKDTTDTDAVCDEYGRNHKDIFINWKNNIEGYKKEMKIEKKVFKQKVDEITKEWDQKIRDAEEGKANILKDMIEKTEKDRKMLKQKYDISDSDGCDDSEEEFQKSKKYIRASRKNKTKLTDKLVDVVKRVAS